MQELAGRKLDHALSCEQENRTSVTYMVTGNSGTGQDTGMPGTEQNVIFKCTVQEYI